MVSFQNLREKSGLLRRLEASSRGPAYVSEDPPKSPRSRQEPNTMCFKSFGFFFLGSKLSSSFCGEDIQRERKKEPILLKYLKQASDLQTDPGIPQQRPQQRPSILLIPTLFPTAALSPSVDLPVNTPRFWRKHQLVCCSASYRLILKTLDTRAPVTGPFLCLLHCVWLEQQFL